MRKLPYSVPSRLIDTTLSMQVDENEIAIYQCGKLVRTVTRSAAPHQRIDYRHVIDWLVRKPGAFANYVSRESLFPGIAFHQAYEALKRHDEARADKRYLKLLHLSAKGSEALVTRRSSPGCAPPRGAPARAHSGSLAGPRGTVRDGRALCDSSALLWPPITTS